VRLSLIELEKLIRNEWSAETAWTPEAWNAANPAAGQCFSTSFVLKSILGGEIVHAEILPHTQPKQRHAWVRLPNGIELDLTADQFPPGQQFRPCELPPDLVWSFGGKQAEVLLARVESKLPPAGVQPRLLRF
jgi:hypothetical protein